jgi:hypothetical protein
MDVLGAVWARRLLPIALSILIASAMAARADVADFYRGKTLRIFVGYAPGTGYDVYARLLGRHLSKYLAGQPGVVIQNMPGAASLTMVNYVYNVAPRDGTAIGLPARVLFAEPLFGNEHAKFEAKKFTWIGSMSRDVAMCFTWHSSGIAMIEDAMKREVLVGSSGVSSGSYSFPQILNTIIGTKFKPILGYPDSAAVGLAMERGELEGYCSFTWASIKSARPQWLEQKAIKSSAAAHVAQASGAFQRADRDGFRQGRGLAAGLRTGLCRSGDGASGLRPARRSGRSRGRVAGGLRRDHEGQGIPRRCSRHRRRNRSDRCKGG